MKELIVQNYPMTQSATLTRVAKKFRLIAVWTASFVVQA
jgi:hypothetical protein